MDIDWFHPVHNPKCAVTNMSYGSTSSARHGFSTDDGHASSDDSHAAANDSHASTARASGLHARRRAARGQLHHHYHHNREDNWNGRPSASPDAGPDRNTGALVARVLPKTEGQRLPCVPAMRLRPFLHPLVLRILLAVPSEM